MTLAEFFKTHDKAAIAFSGGVDSAFLAYTAKKCGADIRAYYVKSAFQPSFELNDAERFAKTYKIDLQVLNNDILSCSEITSNDCERCYFCKRLIFKNIADAAEKDGFKIILDGTNASDDDRDRPGMRAAKELNVLSPLKECGLTKNDIRILSREAGLFTANKPSYSCLATRIKTNETITAEKLKKIEAAESFLFELGFTDFRVRLSGDTARLQFSRNQFERALECKQTILNKMKIYFPSVLSEFEVRI